MIANLERQRNHIDGIGHDLRNEIMRLRNAIACKDRLIADQRVIIANQALRIYRLTNGAEVEQ